MKRSCSFVYDQIMTPKKKQCTAQVDKAILEKACAVYKERDPAKGQGKSGPSNDRGSPKGYGKWGAGASNGKGAGGKGKGSSWPSAWKRPHESQSYGANKRSKYGGY
jgi:hypothetical protein